MRLHCECVLKITYKCIMRILDVMVKVALPHDELRDMQTHQHIPTDLTVLECLEYPLVPSRA